MDSTNLKLTSRDFQEHQTLPVDLTGDGRNLSPALQWSNVPAGTKEFALICADPDAPGRTEPFIHWVIYNISGRCTYIPGAVQKDEHLEVPVIADQGVNDFGEVGYDGPLPPVGHGAHRYLFQLYALDKRLELAPNATAHEVQRAMQGHILGSATLVGLYEREAAWEPRRAIIP